LSHLLNGDLGIYVLLILLIEYVLINSIPMFEDY